MSEHPLFLNFETADLYALLCSPNLVELPGGEYLNQLGDRSIDMLLEWDRKHALKLADLNQKKIRRLGFYAEELLSWFFHQHPRINLLASNHQVVENKQTKGELDFVFIDREDQQAYHLEFAVKYYIQTGVTGGLDDFVGFNRKDTLGKKTKRMLEQQLSVHPQVFDKIKALNGQVPQSIGAMKGRLFYQDSGIEYPELKTNHWCGKLLSSEDSIPTDYNLCHKHAWISGQDTQRSSFPPILTKGELYVNPENHWLAKEKSAL